MDRNEDELSVIRSFMKTPPVDVIGAIKKLGIHYIEEDMDDGSSGRIDIDWPDCTITVNRKEGP